MPMRLKIEKKIDCHVIFKDAFMKLSNRECFNYIYKHNDKFDQSIVYKKN